MSLPTWSSRAARPSRPACRSETWLTAAPIPDDLAVEVGQRLVDPPDRLRKRRHRLRHLLLAAPRRLARLAPVAGDGDADAAARRPARRPPEPRLLDVHCGPPPTRIGARTGGRAIPARTLIPAAGSCPPHPSAGRPLRPRRRAAQRRSSACSCARARAAQALDARRPRAILGPDRGAKLRVGREDREGEPPAAGHVAGEAAGEEQRAGLRHHLDAEVDRLAVRRRPAAAAAAAPREPRRAWRSTATISAGATREPSPRPEWSTKAAAGSPKRSRAQALIAAAEAGDPVRARRRAPGSPGARPPRRSGWSNSAACRAASGRAPDCR